MCAFPQILLFSAMKPESLENVNKIEQQSEDMDDEVIEVQ